VPLPDTLADLEYRGAHRDSLTELAERIDQPDALARVPLWV
jgi:hypothetical protein